MYRKRVTCKNQVLIDLLFNSDKFSLFFCKITLLKCYIFEPMQLRRKKAGVLLFLSLLNQMFYGVPLGCTVAFPVKARGLHGPQEGMAHFSAHLTVVAVH